MARIASMLVWICMSLWLGGMIFLFIAVQTLFAAFPKQAGNTATEAAPRLFAVFEKYQLALAAVALLAVFGWYVMVRSNWIMTIFLLLAICAGAGVYSSTAISSKMQQLRLEGQSGSTEFRKLHGQSMIVYMSQAAVLLIATIMLPFAATPGARRKGPEAVVE